MTGTPGVQFGPHGVKNDDHHGLAALLAAGLAVLAAAILIVAATSLGGSETEGTAKVAAGELRLGPATWTVRRGDTYVRIAEKAGVTVARLEALNPRVDPGRLAVGQRIKLRAVAKRKPKPRGPQAVTVKSGESFGSIAAQRGKTIAELRRLNPKLSPTTLQPGDRMRLR